MGRGCVEANAAAASATTTASGTTAAVNASRAPWLSDPVVVPYPVRKPVMKKGRCLECAGTFDPVKPRNRPVYWITGLVGGGDGMTAPHAPATSSGGDSNVPWPLTLRFGQVACMLNFELADHPTYDGGELQWFDDAVHGTGMLAFLSRRGDRCVDYYEQRGLRMDRHGYQIGGGTRSWTETDFDVARLEVAADGVDADVRFRDADGQLIEIRVDDRNGRPRRRAGLLAPVSAGIERPTSLLLVWMPSFDLVRVTDRAPLIRIDGSDAPTGRLPGRRVHRRHLIKYAAPVLTVELNRDYSGTLSAIDNGERLEVAADGRLTGVVAEQGDHRARLVLEPGLPPLDAFANQMTQEGRWHIAVDDARLTGGTWAATGTTSGVHLALDADERWRPGPLPWLIRLVTTVVPVFRRWPTTYQWRCDVQLDGTPAMTSHWQRTASRVADSYRRATGS
jgi:hypothetical protein